MPARKCGTPLEMNLRYALGERFGAGTRKMTLLGKTGWEIAGGLTAVAAMAGIAAWMALRKRPSPDELELARRKLLVQNGRLVDGMLLDVCSVDATDGRTLTMLLFGYRIGGVDYECSQDITLLSDVVDAARVHAGFPCSVRYQPGNPQNSIVVAEGWSGLRKGLPQLRTFEAPDPWDLSRARPGRG
jgi:hypothetical protein